MAAHIYVYNLIIYIQRQVLFNIHFLTAFYVTLLSKKKKQNLRNKWRSLSSHTCCTVYIEFLCSTLRSKRPYIMNPFCSWIWLPCTFHRQAALFSVSKCQHTCISVVESQCVHKTWWNTLSTSIIQHHSNYASVSQNTFVLLHFMAIIPLNYRYIYY